MKKYIIWVTLILIFYGSSYSYASEWYEGGTLHTAKLRDWKKASRQNQLATCADFISETILDNYFKPSERELPKLKNYALQLLNAINEWANSNGNENDNVEISKTALLCMLQFDWIDKEYLTYLSNLTRKNTTITSNTLAHNQPKTPQSPTKNKVVKVKQKRKLLNKKAGRDWIKHNIFIRGFFPLDTLVSLIGNYEKVTDNHYKTFTLEKFYFKRVEITFLVIMPSNELIGYITGKMR